MRFACWINKATRAHVHAHNLSNTRTHTNKYVILVAYPHNNGLLSAPQCHITAYVHCLSCLTYLRTVRLRQYGFWEMCVNRKCVSTGNVYQPEMCINRKCVSTENVYQLKMCIN